MIQKEALWLHRARPGIAKFDRIWIFMLFPVTLPSKTPDNVLLYYPGEETDKLRAKY